jgi:mRNA deadenylase 3'-5' endonuclease subunit Ccr4
MDMPVDRDTNTVTQGTYLGTTGKVMAILHINENREGNLYAELRKQDADIICLQELEKQHYEGYFYPKLAAAGYSATFCPKQKDSSQTVLDGCAIFWRGDV